MTRIVGQMSMLLLATALLVAACGSGGGGQKPAATSFVPEPTPTPHPWVIDVTSVKYSTNALVGGTMTVTAIVENKGTVDNPDFEFQFNDLSDYADLVGCKPECSTESGFGGVYAQFPGLKAGAKKTYKIEFIPTKIGAAHWDVCVYDAVSSGEQVYCGEGTTAIR